MNFLRLQVKEKWAGSFLFKLDENLSWEMKHPLPRGNLKS